MQKHINTERDYQKALLVHLHGGLAGHKMWALKGQSTEYLGKNFYPDIEIDWFCKFKLRILAIVELKLNSRIERKQSQLYASIRNAPYYCVVDGFRRTPVKWHFNSRSSSEVNCAKELNIIKYSIEEFNYNHFL